MRCRAGCPLQLHHGLNLGGLYIGWTETKGRVALVNAGFDIRWRPAGSILKQADAADGAVAAQVEPVPRSDGYVDQVASFHLHSEDRAIFGMDVKHAASLHGKADFVFAVRMLFGELGEQRV